MMTVTREQLTDFHTFADKKLSNGGARSMQELLDLWLDQRAHEESVASIRESIAEFERGEAIPAEQAFAEIREKLGWKK